MTDPVPAAFGTAVVTLDGRIVSCDPIYASIIGSTPEDLVGRSVSDFADVASGYSPSFMINLLLRTRQPLLTVREFIRTDGSRLLCDVQLGLLKDADGEPAMIHVLLQMAPATRRPPKPSVDRSGPNP